MVKCQVINFELPQKTRDWEERILAYGDPDYIAYWQNFPDGEEGSWESLVKWNNNLWLLVLVALPMVSGGGTLIGSITDVGKAVSKSFNKVSAGDNILAISANTNDVINNPKMRDKLIGAMEKKLDNVAEAVMGKGKKYTTMTTNKEKNSFLNELYTFKTGGKKVDWVKISSLVAAGGTVVSIEGITIATWLLDRTLSVAAKYEPQANGMVLKLPFYPVQNLGLGEDMKFKLSVLDKPMMFDTTAYLASPCKANFEVEMDTCYCDKDSYREIRDGAVYNTDKFLFDLEDLPDTAIDERTDLNGVVNCKLVTKGHDLVKFATDVIPASFKVHYAGVQTIIWDELKTEDKIKAAYYSNMYRDATNEIYSLYREGDTIEVDCAKIKDTWHDEDLGKNFCYASSGGAGTAVLVGSTIVDVALMLGSYGTLTHVAVGVSAFGLSYYTTHATAWPGHAGAYWNS